MFNKYSLGILVLSLTFGLASVVKGQVLVGKFAKVKQNTSVQSTSETLLNKKISLSVNDQSLKEVLNKIQRKSGIHVFYTRDLVEGSPNISLAVKKQPLSELLDQLLEPYGLGYWATGRYIILQKKEATSTLETVSGTVTDESSGEPLPGVNVIVKGTSQGGSTGSEGNYELPVPTLQDTLVFSFIGFQEQEVPINGRTQINVALQTQAVQGEELVVVGYGTQNRETVTGSISSVQASDFNAGQVNDPMTLISGKVAGLAISNPNSGDPNATTDYSLRGPATIQGNSQPLIVVDGVPGGDLQNIAPSNIASIDVLKGGSAAAIYGSRAAAGVIIVTTKKGEPGDTRVSYSGSISTDVVVDAYGMLSAEQYKQLANEQGATVYDEGATTDWFDRVTRKPVSHTHNLSVSGGTENTTYYTSLSYRDFQGIDLVADREFLNGTVRLNTSTLQDKLDFSFKITNSQNTRIFSNQGALAQSLKMYPTFPVKNMDGTFFEKPSFQFGLQWNPVASMRLNSNKSKEKRLLGTANATYSFLPSLEGSITYSVEKNDFLSSSYSSRDDFFQERNGTGGQASRSEDKTTNQNFEATLSYQNNFQGHNFDVIGGYSYQNDFYEGFNAGNNDFSTDAFQYYNLSAGSALNNLTSTANRSGVYVGSYGSERTLISYFGRVIYDYEQRYLVNISVRREGASVLGEDNKWGTFTGFSGGWRLSSEDFMSDVDVVNNLKLRAGYGVTGNQRSLDPYQSLATIGPFYGGTQNAYFGDQNDGDWILPYGPTDNPNPALRWETKKELNLGIDFALFENGWLSGSVDYYDRTIENLVGDYSAQLPPQIFPSIFANAGEMSNEGYELTLDVQLMQNQNFAWNTTFTGSYNRNEIVSISSEQFKGTAQDITYLREGSSIQRLASGQPVAAFYGRRFAGFTEDGNWLFENNEGEAVPASEIGADDFTYLGNSIPRYNLALTNRFNWSNFDLSFLIKSALDYNAVNGKRLFHENLTYLGRNNLFESALENGVQDQPRFSSYYIENGNYVKLKNLTLGYTVPTGSIPSVQNIRLYATGTNLLTITNFSGDDPELPINWNPAEGETSTGPGVEPLQSYYPSVHRFELGVNVSF